MDRSSILSLWGQTLSGKKLAEDGSLPPIEWSSLPTSASYRPPRFGHPAIAQPPQHGFLPMEVLGRGGMGVVFRARQNSLRRDVALKTLRGQDGSSPKDSEVCEQMFLDEALINGSLEHPNIVPVYELGTLPEGAPFLAMQMVGGTTWEQALRADPGELEHQLRILSQVCNAVAFAHSREVIHCDLKPENVMLGEFGEVFLMDWGLAVGTEANRRGVRPRSSIDRPCGTPCYMPPELAEGDGAAVGFWTDTYLLGGILYRLLHGKPPHHGGGFVEVITRIFDQQMPAISESLPPELRQLCRRALAFDPAERFQTARAFQHELEDFLRHRESRGVAARAGDTLAGCLEQSQRAGVLDERGRGQMYQGFAAAAAGFEQALQLWDGNEAAAEGRQRAREVCARTALQLGDLGLAETQLDGLDEAKVQDLRRQIAAARKDRARERAARKRLRWSLLALGLVCLVGLAGGLVLVELNRRAVERERDEAHRQRERAESSQALATRAYASFADDIFTTMTSRVGSPEGIGLAGRLLEEARDGWLALSALDAPSSKQLLARSRLAVFNARLSGRTEEALSELEQILSGYLALGATPDLQTCQNHIWTRLVTSELYRYRHDLPAAQRVLTPARQVAESARVAFPSQSGTMLWASVVLERARVALLAQDLASVESLLSELEACRDILRRQFPLPLLLFSAQLLWADLAVAQGRYAEARSQLAQAEQLVAFELGSALPLSYTSLETLQEVSQRLGSKLVETGDLARGRELLERSLAILRVLERRNPGSLTVSQTLSTVCRDLAEACELAYDLQRAFELFEQSVELERSQDRSPWQLARSLRDYGRLAGRMGQTDLALESLQESLALLRGPDPQAAAGGRPDGELAATLVQLGALQVGLRQLEQAEVLLAESRHLCQQRLDEDSLNVFLQGLLSYSLYQSGQLHRLRGEDSEAFEAARASLAIDRGLIRRDPSELASHSSAANTLRLIAELHQDADDLAAAAGCFEEAVGLRREVAAADAANLDMLARLCGELNRLARVELSRGKLDVARAAVEESLRTEREKIPYDETDLAGVSRYSSALQLGAELDMLAGSWDTALDAYGQCVRLRRQQELAAPHDPRVRRDLAVALADQGRCLMMSGDPESALQPLEEARSIGRRLLRLAETERVWQADFFSNASLLTQCYYLLEQYAQARESGRLQVEVAQGMIAAHPEVGFFHASLARGLSDLASCEIAFGALKEARGLLETCVDELGAAFGSVENERELLEELVVVLSLRLRCALLLGEREEAEWELVALREVPLVSARGAAALAQAAWMLGEHQLASGVLEEALQRVGMDEQALALRCALGIFAYQEWEPVRELAQLGFPQAEVLIAALEGDGSLLTRPEDDASAEGIMVAYLKDELSAEDFLAWAVKQAQKGRRPWLGRAHGLVGMRLEGQGRLEEARQHYQRCVELGNIDRLECIWAWGRLQEAEKD